MIHNHYDKPEFFEKYSQMSRSKNGLAGAGEWAALEPLLPDFAGKKVLDIGCGFGWHAVYAADHGAEQIVGIDRAEKMLAVAKERNSRSNIEYRCCGLEEAFFSGRIV